ncbi:hypothetical protein [Streptomyces sp. N50]|uniref:hypothetical protein n=1 Tax=Streptomyces sp. N50 TaxID=3081765 RepID=UPI0029620730|nr:hypothetical protein [Streptomyces sp. N50]WOX11825.1 hypothetical protein R2B38_24660 [Streptomyces sp. N50]
MAGDSNTEVLKKIAELKNDISTVNTTLSTHVKNGDNLNKKDKEDILNAIKGGPDDEQKSGWQAFFESIGLTDMIDAFKQLSGWSVTVLAIAAGIAFLKDRFLNYGAIANALWEKITGKIWSVGERGLPTQQTRAQTESNNAVTINAHGITPELLNDLKTALTGLPAKVHAFNTKMAEMKSAGTINKVTKAIGKLAEKLDPDPTQTLKDVGREIGNLHTKLEGFDHEKLPKAATLRGISDAAKELNRNAENVKQMFRDLGVTFTDTANRIA